MTYRLAIKEEAQKEWKKLNTNIQMQFKKKLVERLENPHVLASKLSNMPNCYKIKLRSAGYRLVYEVRDKDIVVIVIAVGKRERNEVYKTAIKRL
ncbi:TPA: type II toxin-antitoxin system RelE family toxin [Photobacterium damselae]|uniref:Type II toxin-antitoxin system RelE/ParE family toxin n=2 Tax=Photobacterium damselae TaxID=38293 RepID=A0A7Y7QCC3_PHODD|nr:type II toxin-antitoxin system RelE/ParE family toxin [Photobacterium damselae]ELI6449149.1 type II toxin-antitoxin system RelE/ParE family toxin [Photobacterium damselae]ELV7518255.1 type II toxin-antitoxin system RelE/ParE family toxin [Photobacterium damselae]MCG3826212.1 type II toxin-antitoxin system RelE/ParE family toxin [Photobacterium damselae]MCG9706785.1 type II toxin-antitoxin system RelE/ParE family toxin [Photobacterium damselae]NVH47224.1 type II toxin-antitoxin system RelE/P